MVRVIATLTIKPGALEVLAGIAHPLIVGTRAEPGCRYYDIAASITNPQTMIFVEEWDSRDAFDRHFETPHMAAWRTASAPYVVAARVEVIHPERTEVL